MWRNSFQNSTARNLGCNHSISFAQPLPSCANSVVIWRDSFASDVTHSKTWLLAIPRGTYHFICTNFISLSRTLSSCAMTRWVQYIIISHLKELSIWDVTHSSMWDVTVLDLGYNFFSTLTNLIISFPVKSCPVIAFSVISFSVISFSWTVSTKWHKLHHLIFTNHVTRIDESWRTWLNHVPYMNEPCRRYEWVKFHTWMGDVAHMNESCPMYAWKSLYIYEWINTHMNESCPIYERAMSHIPMGQVP